MGFCGSNQATTDSPQWFDPLGPSWLKDKNGYNTLGSPPTNAVPLRQDIFNQLPGVTAQGNQSAQQLTQGLKTAAQNPGFQAGQDLANKTIAGGFLGGTPEFNAALAKYQAGVGKTANQVKQGALASSVDSTADQRSRYSRAGMGFSTGNQQAAQSAEAAGAARANELAAGIQQQGNQTEEAARVQNNLAERGAQQQGVNQLQTAQSTPLQYLSQIPSALNAPLAQEGQLVSGLASGGPIATPNTMITRQPGIYDYMLSTVGALSGGAGGSM